MRGHGAVVKLAPATTNHVEMVRVAGASLTTAPNIA
jgi:hypothetical protein